MPARSKPLILDEPFFGRPALQVAESLLGKFLVRRIGDQEIAALIHETEAYVGPDDLACHASKGRTPRTDVMFGPAGVWYIYFCYGIHWMLNVVTDGVDHPSAVLLHGAGDWNGPAKLTKALAIDKSLNGLPADPSSGLWIEDRGQRIAKKHIERTPRIGVDYSGDWAAKPYRFAVKPAASPSGSVKRPTRRSADLR